jgi:hypothetical protein
MVLHGPGDKLCASLTCLQMHPSVSQTLPRAVRHCAEQVPLDSDSTDHRHCMPVSTVRTCFSETWNARTNENTATFSKKEGRGVGVGGQKQEPNKIGK